MARLYEVQGVSYCYPAKADAVTPAVRDVSFSVDEGEFVAIVGPSGSGKTTLLHMLEGFVAPDAGRVLFRGRDVSRLSPKDMLVYRNSCVGMVFQFFNLIPHMSALDNVYAPALIANVPTARAREKALGLLEAVGMREKASYRVAELSGGQQQRVAIARALVNDAGVILADEPTGNLDAESTDRVCDLFAQLNRMHGVALVVVTHDERVAARATRIIRLG